MSHRSRGEPQIMNLQAPAVPEAGHASTGSPASTATGRAAG